MRKMVAIALMVLGIIVLVAATAILVRTRLLLPPWSVQTEGRWTAYGMHKWAFLVGEVPLGPGLLLAGILLWPSRPSGLIARGVGAIALLIALAGLVAFAGLTYGLLRNVLSPSPAPPTVLELFSFLLAALAGLAPLLAMTVLAGGVAWKSLPTLWKGKVMSLRKLRNLFEEVKESRISYLLLLPYVVYFLAFLAYPLLFALYLTFHEWAIIAPQKPFVGLQNYVKLLHDDVFWTSMRNVLVYLSINLPAQMILSLALALLVNQKIRFRGFFRSVFFMPSVVSGVVVSTVFLWLYSPQFGLLNYYLGKIGIPPLRWITSVSQAMPSIALMASWRQVGYFAVIYLAGLQAIPPVLYKASAVDGANAWRQFWHVTLPLLNPTILLVLMVSTIWGFLVFTEPFVMTEGGPLHATTTPALYLYFEAFRYLRMGYAATIGVVLGLIILVVNIVEKKWVEREIAY